jgi:hypothetical protein
MWELGFGEDQALAQSALKPPIMRAVILALGDAALVDGLWSQWTAFLLPLGHALSKMVDRLDPPHRLQLVILGPAAVPWRVNRGSLGRWLVWRVGGTVDWLELPERAALRTLERVALEADTLPELTLCAVVVSAVVKYVLRNHLE